MRISDWSSDVCSSDLVLLLDAERDRSADHHLGQLGLAGRRVGGADQLAAADHADPVADRLDLAQLVGDEDDGGALLLEPAHEIGRASCRARVCQYVWISVGAESLKKKKQKRKQ